ncbi:MAG: glycosyltransferase [Roseibacillus sp.]
MAKVLRIGITLPPNQGVGTGNLRTAQRWVKIFAELGHEPRVYGPSDLLDCDVLVALNAVKSHEAISRFHYQQPRGKLVVAVTGTDMNRSDSEAWRNSMAWADRVVVLQGEALKSLKPEMRKKAQVIFQSVSLPVGLSTKTTSEGFQVCVVGHLRKEKDPMLTALASRLLDEESDVRVIQVGAILENQYLEAVEVERAMNPRYQWLGELPQQETLELILQSNLMVLSSSSEGGPGVVGEAVVAGTPILSTRIDGVIGLLGKEYPGYFEAGDGMMLSQLLKKAESEQSFYRSLKEACGQKKEQFSIQKETESWEVLLEAV